MSKQAARAFCEKIKTDRALAGKLTALGTGFSDEDVVRVAKDAGFDCTADELDAAGKELSSELSDEDLAQVAGGVGVPTGAVTGDPSVRFGVQICATVGAMKYNVSKG